MARHLVIVPEREGGWLVYDPLTRGMKPSRYEEFDEARGEAEEYLAFQGGGKLIVRSNGRVETVEVAAE